MISKGIRVKRDRLAKVECGVNWCDDADFDEENMPGAGPGGDVNLFGWFVVGTTVGGNGIVVREDDPGVYFASHEGYTSDSVFIEGGDPEYVELNAENVRRSLRRLAATIEEFVADPEAMESQIDDID